VVGSQGGVWRKSGEEAVVLQRRGRPELSVEPVLCKRFPRVGERLGRAHIQDRLTPIGASGPGSLARRTPQWHDSSLPGF